MSMNDPTFNSPSFEQAPPKTGMSGGSKVLVGLGIGCAVVVFLCCGGGILLGLYFKNYAQQTLNQDPQVVKQKTDQIAKIKLPAAFQPTWSMDMKVPFTGQPMMLFTVWEDPAAKSTIMLGLFGPMFAQNQAQMQASFNQQMQQQGKGGSPQPLQNQKISSENLQIRGKPVTFVFTEGKDPQSGRSRIQVNGSFQGSNGPTMVIGDFDAQTYPKEKVVSILETIQ